jgi:hypothetical protein
VGVTRLLLASPHPNPPPRVGGGYGWGAFASISSIRWTVGTTMRGDIDDLSAVPLANGIGQRMGAQKWLKYRHFH